MKRIEFMCDGCDKIEYAKLDSVRTIDFMMEGWLTHRIVAHENGSEAYEITSDLCPVCSENLRRAINPANWPRMKAASNEPLQNPPRSQRFSSRSLDADIGESAPLKRTDSVFNPTSFSGQALGGFNNVKLQTR